MNKNILFFVIFVIGFQNLLHGMQQADAIVSLYEPYKNQTIILNALPMKIWGRIFAFIWQESFQEGEYAFCKNIRNLLITCKRFYYDKELLELIVASNVKVLNSTYGMNKKNSIIFVPTLLYLNTELSKFYLKELLKNPGKLERAQKVLKYCYGELAAINNELSESEEKTKSVAHYQNLIRQIENCGVSLQPES